MRSPNKREQDLVFDLLRNRLSEDEFHREFPISPGNASETGLAMLERAARDKDPIGVEFGLYLGHRFGISTEYVEVLSELSQADWHTRHEDIADGLAELKSPASVGALYGMAVSRFPYRDYDEAYSLGVKSIYALGAIRSPEAIEKLGLLSRSGNETLESEARRQLANIASSRATEALRDMAKRLLSSK